MRVSSPPSAVMQWMPPSCKRLHRGGRCRNAMSSGERAIEVSRTCCAPGGSLQCIVRRFGSTIDP